MKTLFIIAVVMVLSISASAFECGTCKPELCDDPGYCEYGLTKDACDCCSTCYHGLGDYCGGPQDIFGICAEDFECIPLVGGDTEPQDPEMVGICQKKP